MLKELQRLFGFYAATVLCWIANKLDRNLWWSDTEEDE